MYVHVHLQKLHRGKLLIANATVHLVVGFVRVLVHGLIVTRDHFVANVTEVHIPRYLFIAAMTYRRLNGTRSKKNLLLLLTIINKNLSDKTADLFFCIFKLYRFRQFCKCQMYDYHVYILLLFLVMCKINK